MNLLPGKILILDQPDPILIQFLNSSGFEVNIDTHSSFQELCATLVHYQGVILRSRWTLDAHFFEAAPHLIFVARLGVGIEHIDIECIKKKQIHLFTTPEGSKDTVAEHTIGLILMLLNKLGKADREVRNNQWDRNANKAIELKGKTVGILGFGNMGNAVAKKLAGFEVQLIFKDILKKEYHLSYVEQVDDQKFFNETDILTIHIPYDESNKYFVNHDYLKKFKKNIFVINTARGPVLETEGLVQHLKDGKILGAALDVIEYEEQSFNFLDLTTLPLAFKYLQNAENVILNPHLAGLSFEAVPRHAWVVANKIANLFKLKINV